MGPRKIDHLNVFEPAIAAELGDRLGTAPHFGGRISRKADTGDTDELFEIV
jgi:hypothetical protein